MGGDASGEGGLLIEVADAAQIAFALFADVAENDEGSSEFDFRRGGGLARGRAGR